jgi:hypothetical protein
MKPSFFDEEELIQIKALLFKTQELGGLLREGSSLKSLDAR